MFDNVKMLLFLAMALPLLGGCGSAQLSDTAAESAAEREARVLESELRKADTLMAQVTRLTDRYVHRRAPMIDKDRMDALAFMEEAYTILLNLQNKYPDRPEIEKRLRRACNLLEFLRSN